MTIVSGKNTYVDEAQKAEHEKMVENIAKCLEAKDMYETFCILDKEYGKMLRDFHADAPWMEKKEEEILELFPCMSKEILRRISNSECKFSKAYPEQWALIKPLKFEKGVL
jgi:hypothetical protein